VLAGLWQHPKVYWCDTITGVTFKVLRDVT